MIYTVTLNPVLDCTLTVPSLHFNEVLRVTQVHRDAGGKGLNVSRALKLLGVETVALGFVGGSIGQQLESSLARLGIITDFIHIDSETRTNTVIIEAASGAYVKANESGPVISEQEQQAFIEKVKSLLQPGDTWIMSGSLPPGLPPDFYATLIGLARSCRTRVFLDASGAALSLGCAAIPYLIKPNLEEASQAIGHPVDSTRDRLETIEHFLSLGIELVALSAGEEGLWLASRQACICARPPHITAHNPVGTGDAVVAGRTWSLLKGLPLDEAARWATACGTAAAMASGVNFGSLAAVQSIYDQVSIQPLGFPQIPD